MADTNFPASPNPSDIEDPEEDSISQPPVTAPEEPEADAPATPTAEVADVAEQELVRPPVKKYSEWLTGEVTTPLDAFEGLNQKESATAAQISNVKRYVDYWRNELLDRGKYEGAKTEKFLSGEYNQASSEIRNIQLEEGEEFDDEKVNAAVAEASITPGKDSVKKRLELIATLDDTTIQRIGLLTGEDEIAESIRARADFLLKSNPQTDSEREVYAESVNSLLDEVKTNLDEVGVRQNKIPFAKVIKVDEGPSIISSAKAIEEAGGIGPAISQSIRDGYLDPEDAADVYREYVKVDEKSKLNRAQIVNASEIRSVIPNVVNRIEDNDMLENALKEAAGSFNKWEELDSITEQAESGPPQIEDSEELRKTQESRQRYYDLLAETINKSEVAPVGLKVDPTDKSFHAAADLYAQEMASQINPESFVVEGDLSKNIKENPLTGDLYVHPASYLRPDIFEKSMDEKGLNDMQKSILRAQRDTSLDRFSVGGIKFLATEDGTTWKEYIESQGGEEEIRNAYREELYEKRRAKVSSGEMSLEESANYYPDTEAKPIGSYVADFLTKAKPNGDFIYGMGMLGEVVHSPAYYVQSIPLLAGQVPGKIGESIRGTKMYESAENAAVSLARANMEDRANIEALGYKPGFLYDLSVGAAGLVGQLATDFVLTRGLGGALKLGGAKALGMKGAKATALKKVMGLVTSEKALAKATAAKGAERANYYKELLSNARRVIPGKKLTEVGGVAARASLASYSRNVGSSLAQIQDNPETAGLPLKQQREMAADIAAVRTGLEATLTAGFSFLGMDAVESLILKGASTGTVKKAMAQFAKVDNLSNKEFAAIAGKALREVEKDLGVSSNGLSKFILGTASEAVEEGLPESAGVIFEDFVFNYLEYDKLASEEPMQRLWDKYLTFSKYVIEGNIDGELALEALKSGGYEGAIGGILGGTISGGRSIGGAVRSRMGRSSEETVLAARKGQELVSQRISDKLTDSGSPITAEVVRNFLRSPARGKKFNGKTREEVEEMISSGTLTQEEAVAMGLAAPAQAPAPTAETTTAPAPEPTAETTTAPAPEPAPTAEATTTTEPAETTTATAETTTAPAETTTAPAETTTEQAPTPTTEPAEATTAPEVVDDAPPVTTRLSAEEEIAIEETLRRVSEGDREAADDTTRLNSPTVAPDAKVETNTPDQNVERAASNVDGVSLIDKKLETPSTEAIKTKTAGLADETARVEEAGGKVVYVEDVEAADKEIRRVNGGRGLTDAAKKSFSNSVAIHTVVDGKPVTFIFESKSSNKNAAGLRKILQRSARHAAITTAVGRGGVIQPSADTAKKVSKKTPRYNNMSDAEKVLAVIELIEDGKITLDPKQDADFITYLRELAGKVGVSNTTAGIDLSSIISKTVGEPILPPDSDRIVQNMEQRMRNGRTVRRFNQKTVDDKAGELGADGDKYRAFVRAIEEALSSIPSTIPIRLVTGDNNYAAATQGRIEINLGLLFDLYNNILELDLTNKDDLKKVTAHLDRAINEELGHISSRNSIPEKLFQKVVKGMSDSDFEYIISTYYAYDSQAADNARAGLRSGDPELVARAKEYLTEEFLRQAGQDRSGGFTTEDSMRLLVGGDEVRSNFRQVAIEYLKAMYRRITNKTRMGRILSGPERAALSRMRNEMWYLSNEFADPLPNGYSYSGTPTGPAADAARMEQALGAPGIVGGAAYRDGAFRYNQIADRFMEFFPEDADIDEVEAGIEDLPAAERNFYRALSREDWLGFDYPSQAIDAILEEPDNFELSTQVKAALGRYVNIISGDSILYAPRISNRDARDDVDYMDAIDRGDYDMAEEALMRVGERYGVTDPELIFRDNDGNIMTPSQRFMTPPSVLTPEKIARHKELEAKYNAGTLTQEEEQEAGRIVEEAARGAGYEYTNLYHGTLENRGEFSVFEIGSNVNDSFKLAFDGLSPGWFTSNKEQAGKFGDRIISAHIKLKKPLTLYADDFALAEHQNRRREWLELHKKFNGDIGLNYQEQLRYRELRELGADKAITEGDSFSSLEKLGREAEIEFPGVSTGEAIRLGLQEQGYDGLILESTLADSGSSITANMWVVPFYGKNQIKSADPFTGVPIDERFDPGSESILYTPRFVDSGIIIGTEVEVDIRPTLETLVAPIYHTNDVDLGNWMKRTIITGDIADERIRNMIISVDRFAKVIPDFMKEFESRMRKEIKKLGVMDDSVRELFNTAVGTEDIIVDKDDINRINENLNKDLAIIRSTEPEKFRAPAEGEIDTIIAGIVSEDVSKQKGFTKEELQDKAKEKFRKKLEEEATEKANKERQKVFDDAAKKKKIEVAEALATLELEVPSLAQLVIDVRQAITDISEFAAERLPLSEDMKIIFDSTQGFYLSRRYRFFNDPDYRSTLLEEVASDTVGQFHSQIADVIPIFKENLYKETRESVLKTEIRNRILSGELTIDQLKDESVIDELRIEIEPIVNQKIPDPEKSARAALQEYLESFGNRREQQYSEQGARFIDSVLKNKKDLPESFTKLLGKYDTESDPLGSFRVMLQTVGAQTAMLASAMKLQNLVDINDRIENVDGKFLLTKKEYDAKVEKGEISREDFKAWDQKGGSMSHSDPLKGMYVESGIYKGLTAKKNKIDMDTATQTDRGIHFGTGVIGFLTGMSMMAVTSVSGVGFHLRNTISNIYRAANTGQLFDPRFISTMLARTLAESALIVPFVPQKVRYIPDKIARMMKGERVSLDELMTEHFKLQSLSVVNQSMDAASLRNVFNPTEQKATDFYAKLEEFDNKSKLGRISRKALLGYFGYIQKLNNASDNAYRLTSYYRYKRLLEKAKESGKGGTFRGVEVSQMSPSQIEKEAALMMNKVTPGDDYLVQSARYITESNLRFIAAPFTRFRAEVFRTFVNSFKETYALFNSGNPALQREGAKRSAGLLALIGISFGPATSLLSKLLGGFDEEEQDVLDEGNPDFFKTAQIIRQRKGDVIIDHNFTYMNENAMFGDAFTYAMQEMRAGKSGSEAAINGLTRFVFHEVLGEQILAGVISDIRNNQDAGTKRAIVSDLDSGPEQFLKVSEYALNRLSPSSFRGIAEGFAAYEVTEGEALDKLESASKAFALRSVVPTKPFSKPIQDRMRDTLKRYGRMRTDNDYTKSKLASQFKSVSGKQRKYTDKEIEDIANEYMTKTVRIFDRVDRVVKGYRKMGVSDKKIYDELKDSFNMRQDHAKYYLDTGRFILPDFSKTQYEELNKYEDIDYANKKVGAFRDQLNKYVTKNPKNYRIYTPNTGVGD